MHRVRWLAIAILALLCGAAVAHASPPRVVFVTHGQAADQYWSVVKKGVDDAARTLGVEVEYLAPEIFDMQAMANLLKAAIASKPDGLVVSLPDKDALSDLVKNAVDIGIPVIVIDSGGSELSRSLGALLFMGENEYDAGVAAGRRAALLGVKKAVCVNHEVGNTSLDDRCRGFRNGLGSEVPVLQGVLDPIEMKRRIIVYLRTNPDIDFILTTGSVSANPVLAAVDEMGRSGKIRLGSFDISPAVLQAIRTGRMEWGIDAQQYLMGYMPVVIFNLMTRYRLAPVVDYPTGPGFVTKSDAAAIVELANNGFR
jgi:simple sugar transport system substrate-binding protein